MSEQASGGYRCNVCGMTFNSLSDLDAHTRESHNTDTTTAPELHFFTESDKILEAHTLRIKLTRHNYTLYSYS